MESYEKEWLAGQPILLAILHLVGLFDRPASGDCLKALRAKPAIRGLTDEIVELDESDWQRAVARSARSAAAVAGRPIRSRSARRPSAGARMVRRPAAADQRSGVESRAQPPLRPSARTTHEGSAPTLADLAPLYHAIAHGCRAGRYQEALDDVFMNRICRRRPDGQIEFYTSKKLGAAGSDLAAISWFFDPPYETPAAALMPPRSRLGP